MFGLSTLMKRLEPGKRLASLPVGKGWPLYLGENNGWPLNLDDKIGTWKKVGISTSRKIMIGLSNWMKRLEPGKRLASLPGGKGDWPLYMGKGEASQPG